MIKIAFIGLAGSGKTTAAKYLEDTYGFCIVSFAAKLKENLLEIGINPDRLYKTKDPLCRSLMQVYGECMRDQNLDHWVNEAMFTINALEHDGFAEGVLVDDLRFLNEADRLRDEGFVLVRIERRGGPFGLSGLEAQHCSETEQEDIAEDYTITCDDGDLACMYDQLNDLVQHIQNGEDDEEDLD